MYLIHVSLPFLVPITNGDGNSDYNGDDGNKDETHIPASAMCGLSGQHKMRTYGCHFKIRHIVYFSRGIGSPGLYYLC